MADKIGRKWIVVIGYYIFCLIVIGIFLGHDITTLYVLIFLAGMTFGSRVIVSIVYTLEFISEKNK